MPPSKISIKANGKDRLIEFMIGEKWLVESRLVLDYCSFTFGPPVLSPDSSFAPNRFVVSLSESRDEPRVKTDGINYYWHGMLLHKTTEIVPDAAPEATAEPETPDPNTPVEK